MASSSITNSTSNGSGIDVQGTVDQLMYVERAPERLLQVRQSALEKQATALSQVQSQLNALSDTLDLLTDPEGALASKSAGSSNPNVASVSASSSAQSGTHTLLVSQLASTSTYYSETFATNATLAHGKFSLSVGTGKVVEITVDSANDSVDKLSTYINGLNAGVTASSVRDANGVRLILVSQKSGASGQISISGSAIPFAINKGADGLNAKFKLDGVELESATNTVAGALAGVTINIRGTSSADVQVVVSADTSRAQQAISNFVSSYNTTISGINNQFTYSAATKSSGILAGDPTIRALQTALLANASHALDESSVSTLAALGIKMQSDGTLSIDSSKLSETLETKMSEVQQFFQSDELDGYAKHFSKSLAAITDSIDGSIHLDITGNKSEQDSIADQIDAYEVRMEMRQKLLLDQFSRIDTLLRKFSATQAQLTTELGSLE